MKSNKIYLVIFFALLNFPICIGQWQTIFSNSGYYFSSVRFLNQDTGIVTTGPFGTYNGCILRTIDGGNAWQIVDSGYLYVSDMEFVNDSIGFVVGGKAYGFGYRGIIIKTIDAGVTWNEIWNGISDTIGSMNSIQFTSKDTGYIYAEGDAILKTVDGGLTWNKMYITNLFNPSFQKLFFATNTVGYIFSNTSGTVYYKTTDGGNSWNSYSYQGSITDVYFHDPDTGVIMTGIYLYKTFDGGLSWTPISDTIANIMRFKDHNVGLSANGATIYMTANGGFDWHQQLDTSGSIQDFSFVDSCTIFAVGNSIILRTDNGGIPTPTINLIGSDSLVSSEIGDSYFWYRNDTAISVHTPYLIPTTSGNYKVVVLFAGCSSAPSTDYYFNVSSVNEINNGSFKVYPNPSNGEINITSHSEISRIEIFNSIGHRIYLSEVSNVELSLQLESGLYFIICYDFSQRILARKKIIVHR